MFELLPKEVCDDIFLRLPIKNLVILCCTCKTLLNFIINPDFMNAHNKKSKDNPFILLRYFVDNRKDEPFKRGSSESENKVEEFFCLHQDDGSFRVDLLRMMEFPIDNRANPCFNILGSCNGVVCLSDDFQTYTEIIYLWNPSIRKFKKLPYPKVGFGSIGPYEMCVGFGFDQFTNDYKVVRLVYPEAIQMTPFPKPPVVEIYSLNSDSWKTISASSSCSPLYSIRGMDYYVYRAPYSQCFLNGAVHWAGYKDYDGVWSTIVTFDVHEECFGEMKLPACLEGLSTWESDLCVKLCRNMLGLIKLPHSRSDKEFRIWVMEEYDNVDSWSLLYRFDDPSEFPLPRAFFFRKNNDILSLVCFRHKGSLVPRILSIRNGRDQDEDLGSLEVPAKGLYLGLYEEGLALFNEGKAISRVADDESEFGSVEDESNKSESASED